MFNAKRFTQMVLEWRRLPLEALINAAFALVEKAKRYGRVMRCIQLFARVMQYMSGARLRVLNACVITLSVG